MGSGASQREETESAPSTPPTTESELGDSPRPPIIIITAPSREDIYASPSKLTITDSIKERRPTSTPIVVGKKLVKFIVLKFLRSRDFTAQRDLKVSRVLMTDKRCAKIALFLLCAANFMLTAMMYATPRRRVKLQVATFRFRSPEFPLVDETRTTRLKTWGIDYILAHNPLLPGTTTMTPVNPS